MRKVLNDLEKKGFYCYESKSSTSIIKDLQLKMNLIWIEEGVYDNEFLSNESLNLEGVVEIIGKHLSVYRPLPLHRHFSLDQEDVSEYPPTVFEDRYLYSSLENCGVNIIKCNEFEDSEGNLHLTVNENDFLICPGKLMRSGTYSVLRWRVATSNILHMLNKLLSQVGSSEKFYVLDNISEELISFVMLTPDLVNFFQSTPELNNECLPQLIEDFFDHHQHD